VSYHIVSIDAPTCSLSCRDGQLTCRDDHGERRLPLEDIAAIVITSFSAHIHSRLLIAAAQHGIGLVVCERFKPVALLLPANRATDTQLTRAQVRLPAQLRRRLWQKTLDAKCANQCHLAGALAPEDARLERFRALAGHSSPHKESECARLFWSLFADYAVKSGDFKRRRDGDPPNNLLNFGYAVLLSNVLQKLFALGIDPTFGIAHAIREHATPLAYDLMEPFRPAVDRLVLRWLREHPAREDWTVTTEYRRAAAGLLAERWDSPRGPAPLETLIERTLRSFRQALTLARSGPYLPWIPTPEKWAGC
jgi:CRISPR-associated protein Cas1